MKKVFASFALTAVIAVGTIVPAQAVTVGSCDLYVTNAPTHTSVVTNCYSAQARMTYVTAAGAKSIVYSSWGKSVSTSQVPSWMKQGGAGRAKLNASTITAWYS